MNLLAALALATALAAAPAPAVAAAAPRVRVEPASFDFGRALPGRTLRKQFSLRNHGTRDLLIEAVSTSCGCTAALAGEKTVRPGRSTPLTVTLQTRNDRGRVERKVLVRTNDPQTPLVEISLLATVEPPPAR